MAHFSVGNSRLRGFLNAGAFLGVWVDSHRHGKALEGLSDIWTGITNLYEFDEDVEFESIRDNLFDAGLLIGLGIQYEWEPVTFFIEGRFNYGLTDLQKKYMYELLPRINDTFVITAGVLFNRNVLRRR
jgi:hypothetical protein